MDANLSLSSRQKQLHLLCPEEIWQETLLIKLKGAIHWQVWENLAKCGKEEIFCTCKGCGNVERFFYKCCMKFCPLCNWRIQRERTKLLELWSLQIKQPKHIVVTMKNFPTLTRKRIREFGRAFAKLRRTKLWREVRGGCISTEITNEGRGWHLHAHVLADVRFLPAGELAIEWGRLTGQQFGIVKVMDAREKSYLGECCKYVVKPAQFVSWPWEQILEFVLAIRGVRFFRTFGSMFKIAARLRAEIELMKPPKKPCDCGCEEFVYEDEATAVLHDLRREARR
jgi:Replication protein